MPSFKPMSRLERQKSNLGGIIRATLFAVSDFTADWPREVDVPAGILAIALPLKTGVTGATLTFDNGTCRVKSAMKGKIGYQNFDHEMEAKFAGFEATQVDALKLLMNEGGVAICTYKDGKRVVVGTSYEPLAFEVAYDSGAKSDDALQISFKAKLENSVAFAPPILAPTVTIPLPV